MDLAIAGVCWERIASEDCEVREQTTWTRGYCTDLRPVPPPPFTTFHLRMLANADAQSDKVETFPCHRAIVVDILLTAGRTPLMAFFSTPYRLGRNQLEGLRFLITGPNSATRGEYNKSPHRLGYDVSHFVGKSQLNSSLP
jgi:hypothetical protein